MEPHVILIGAGGILLASLVADVFGRRLGLPRVSLLVLIGVIAGPHGLAFIPSAMRAATDLVAAFALTMVAFLLGSELSGRMLRRHGREILILSIAVVLVTVAVVCLGLLALGASVPLALLLGAIAAATDPAATREVTVETDGKADLKEVLLGIVAIDDAWGLLVFGVAAALAAAMMGNAANTVFGGALTDIGEAIVIGVLVGIPAAYLSGRIRPGKPSQSEAIGAVLVCGGMAHWLGVSYLLAAMVAGALVANLAKHHEQTFREIEHFEWPFLAVFFVLAGASLELSSALASGALGAGYIVLRFAGRVAGGWLGGALAGVPRAQAAWIGTGLMPQAGVAVGMALVAARDFPALGETILAIAIGGTVVFELIGPVLTRLAIHRGAG